MSKVAIDPRASPGAVCLTDREHSKECDRGGPLLEESNVMINAIPGPEAARCGAPEWAAAATRENAVAEFLLSREVTTRAGIDVTKYWEKRRVQNALRRVLEAIYEYFFGLETDFEADDLGTAFDKVAERGGSQRWANDKDLSLTEQQFTDILEVLGIWPPELCPKDKSEIFTSLLVPSAAAARRVLDGELLRTHLTRRMFCDGFTRVPFNLPDFPVPTTFMSQSTVRFTREQSDAVAKAVASTFAMEKGGPSSVKDPFLSGLVSLEEIQAALPKLLTYRLVEDAVARIVQATTPLFSVAEWEELVIRLRMQLQQGGEVRQRSGEAPCQAFSPRASEAKDAPNPEAERLSVSLASPRNPCRDVETGFPADTAPRREAEVAAPRFQPVTEPLPCREVRNEDPVCFVRPELGEAVAAARKPDRVINWNTAVDATGSLSRPHRLFDWADAGAGAPPAQAAGNLRKEEPAAVMPGHMVDKAVRGGVDYLAWVNLGLHAECGGPYLLRAFVRCCQLYERQGDVFQKPGNDQ